MPMLDLRLLGGIEARIGDREVAFPTRHSALLLAWLALSPGRAHPRDRLAGLLWPDRPEEQARTSLRQALHRLRAALEGAEPFPLEIDGRSVRLDSAALRCDLAELEAAGPQDPEGLERAVERVRGELLEGVEAGDPEVEAWLLSERARVRRIMSERFGQLSALHEAARRFGEVEALARRQLASDPFDEAALRRLMSAAAHQGRRNAALAAFRAHADRLREELSVAPEPETVALWQAIRGGAFGPAGDPPERDPPPEPTEVAPAKAATEPSDATGSRPERRHVAVLHLSMAGLTGRAADWDPEAAAEAAAATRRRLDELVARHGGEVLHASTAEVVASFGGSERPALSAARAAIEARAATGVAAGIHAGDALVGAGADPGPVALVARRLAEASDGVALSEAARAECDGYLRFEPAPSLALPGLEAPLPTWRPTGPTGARNSWQARAGRGLSPLVGREAELETLRRGLARAEGAATVAVVSAEAGMGKSRLLHEFLCGSWAEGHRVIETGVAAYQTEATHSALGTLVRSWAGAGPDAPPEAVGEATATRLRELEGPEDILPALRLLLDLPVEDPGWASLSAAQRRRRVVEALRTVLEIEGRRRAAILVFEDAHWIDADTGHVLDALVESLGSAHVLVAITARPEYHPAWLHHSFARLIRLEGLDREETERLTSALTGGAEAPGLGERLHARTGGVPLFIEEILRDLAECGEPAGPADLPEERPIPASIRGVLSSRIDRLPAEQRHVLQTAAAIGASVLETLLAPLADLPPERLDEALAGLEAAELLYRIRGHPEREYAFKHALTQEVAYRGLLLSRREALHGRLLGLCEARYEGQIDAHVEDLARHARLGAAWERAAHYLARAGERAIARSAYPRARVLFEQALEALERLPSDEGTRRAALDLHVRLRAVLMVLGDYDGVLGHLTQAEAIASALGDPPLLAEIRIHLAFFHATSGEFDRGIAAADLALETAREVEDPLPRAEACMAKGQLLRMRGDYGGAAAALRTHLDIWSGPYRHHRGVNLGTRSVFAHAHLGVCLAYLGEREEAWRCLGLARAIAEETRRPVDLQFALLHEGIVAGLEERTAESLALLDEALAIARTAELPFFGDWIVAERGEALLHAGEAGAALDLLVEACARPPGTVVEQFDALAKAALGKAQVLAGLREAAEATLREVLAYARRVGHPQLEQIALRRLAWSLADPAAAEAALDEAIRIAEASDLRHGLSKSLLAKAELLSGEGREEEACAARARAAELRRALGLPG